MPRLLSRLLVRNSRLHCLGCRLQLPSMLTLCLLCCLGIAPRLLSCLRLVPSLCNLLILPLLLLCSQLLQCVLFLSLLLLSLWIVLRPPATPSHRLPPCEWPGFVV